MSTGRFCAGLIEKTGVAGNLTADAHLASLAISRGAVLVSCDADFSRFRGLRWENPLLASEGLKRVAGLVERGRPLLTRIFKPRNPKRSGGGYRVRLAYAAGYDARFAISHGSE